MEIGVGLTKEHPTPSTTLKSHSQLIFYRHSTSCSCCIIFFILEQREENRRLFTTIPQTHEASSLDGTGTVQTPGSLNIWEMSLTLMYTHRLLPQQNSRVTHKYVYFSRRVCESLRGKPPGSQTCIVMVLRPEWRTVLSYFFASPVSSGFQFEHLVFSALLFSCV